MRTLPWMPALRRSVTSRMRARVTLTWPSVTPLGKGWLTARGCRLRRAPSRPWLS